MTNTRRIYEYVVECHISVMTGKKYTWEKKIRFTRRGDWKRGVFEEIVTYVARRKYDVEIRKQSPMELLWCRSLENVSCFYRATLPEFERGSRNLQYNASHEGECSVASRYLRGSVTIFHVARENPCRSSEFDNLKVPDVISPRYLLNLGIWWESFPRYTHNTHSFSLSLSLTSKNINILINISIKHHQNFYPYKNCIFL